MGKNLTKSTEPKKKGPKKVRQAKTNSEVASSKRATNLAMGLMKKKDEVQVNFYLV